MNDEMMGGVSNEGWLVGIFLRGWIGVVVVVVSEVCVEAMRFVVERVFVVAFVVLGGVDFCIWGSFRFDVFREFYCVLKGLVWKRGRLKYIIVCVGLMEYF